MAGVMDGLDRQFARLSNIAARSPEEAPHSRPTSILLPCDPSAGRGTHRRLASAAWTAVLDVCVVCRGGERRECPISSSHSPTDNRLSIGKQNWELGPVVNSVR